MREQLVGAGRIELADTAALLVSEVVTNAVLHARSQVHLTVDCDGRAVRVEVADSSPAAPARRSFTPNAGTGRGLLLVDELADAWGLERADDGKIVWFEVGSAA